MTGKIGFWLIVLAAVAWASYYVVGETMLSFLQSADSMAECEVVGAYFLPWLFFIFLVALPSTVIGFLLILYQIVKRVC